MSDQPGFRQPDPQESPTYAGSADPYAQPLEQTGQTERMPTYPQGSPDPYAQPTYGELPRDGGSSTGYAQPAYGDPAQPSYGADYGQAPYGQSPYAQGAPQPNGMTPYGQQAYGQQPGYGYGYPEHPQATTILVLGILGFFVPIVPFVAWYMGGQIKRQIESGAPYQWDGTLKIGYLIGKILGIIQIASVVLTIVWLVFVFGLFATTSF